MYTDRSGWWRNTIKVGDILRNIQQHLFWNIYDIYVHFWCSSGLCLKNKVCFKPHMKADLFWFSY